MDFFRVSADENCFGVFVIWVFLRRERERGGVSFFGDVGNGEGRGGG